MALIDFYLFQIVLRIGVYSRWWFGESGDGAVCYIATLLRSHFFCYADPSKLSHLYRAHWSTRFCKPQDLNYNTNQQTTVTWNQQRETKRKPNKLTLGNQTVSEGTDKNLLKEIKRPGCGIWNGKNRNPRQLKRKMELNLLLKDIVE